MPLRKEKAMTNNIDNMARIEREIEKRMEAACEKNGWVVAVAMMPPETTTLHIEKFCGCLWGLVRQDKLG